MTKLKMWNPLVCNKIGQGPSVLAEVAGWFFSFKTFFFSRLSFLFSFFLSPGDDDLI